MSPLNCLIEGQLFHRHVNGTHMVPANPQLSVLSMLSSIILHIVCIMYQHLLVAVGDSLLRHCSGFDVYLCRGFPHV